jgi:hypothetical protein
MSKPQLHHYVPRFYLSRFTDTSGYLWIWERDRDRIFHTKPYRVAAEKDFYRVSELAERGHDPLLLEKQLSHLEGEVAQITGQWLNWLREMKPQEKIEVPDVNRDLVSLYIALQFLRTKDARDILAAFAEEVEKFKPMSAAERQQLHLHMLWNSGTFRDIATRIKNATWIFGRNTTSVPFISSDNPVAFRTADNSMWLKAAIGSAGTYSVFPLAPDIVMYCHPAEHPWKKLRKFDRCLSPISFTEGMVESENGAQVFMASRFVISSRNNFDREREFAKTIGTDVYKAYWIQKQKSRPVSRSKTRIVEPGFHGKRR